MLRPSGLILAGGRSSRMGGGDKALLRLGNRTLMSHVIGRVLPQCMGVAISANGNPGRFAFFGHPVIPDQVEAFAGPLGGVLAGLTHIRHAGEVEWLLTVPGDTPFVPFDLVQRLGRALSLESSPIAHARSGDRSHPLVALWHISVFSPLRVAVQERELRRVQDFQAEMRALAVEWPIKKIDPFFNINTPDDLAAARDMLDPPAENPAH